MSGDHRLENDKAETPVLLLNSKRRTNGGGQYILGHSIKCPVLIAAEDMDKAPVSCHDEVRDCCHPVQVGHNGRTSVTATQ